jgi:uncharacterized RDD family membrane protein YckC
LSQSGSLPNYELFDPQPNESAAPQWKQEVNQRLAAHRSRRPGAQDAAANRAAENPRAASARAAEAAARVAARYAKAPSYSQLLAGEARAVVRAAGAAAEAARSAQAAAQAVLAGLESGFEPEPAASGFWEPEPTIAPSAAIAEPQAPPRWQDEPPAAEAEKMRPYAGAQPRWEEALPTPAARSEEDVWSQMRVHPSPEPAGYYRADAHAARHSHRAVSDEGELFPGEAFGPYDAYDPMGSATVEPIQHLPANLIEFPRELIATRKARPRLAEGPFYDDSHHNSQLSIFEVDPALLPAPMAHDHASRADVAPPEWASIELDHRDPAAYASHYDSQAANPAAFAEHSYVTAAEIPTGYANQISSAAVAEHLAGPSFVKTEPVEQIRPYIPAQPRDQVSVPVASPTVAAAPVPELLVAAMSDRLLASVVDGALVTLAFVAAAVVVIASTSHPPAGRMAIVAGACGWMLFGLLYQFLFLSYAEEGTPGMRYARIALCTFDDDNLTVEQMRRRIPAMLLAALPACVGLAWAFFDKDHLGWHDRLTRTYQRKY